MGVTKTDFNTLKAILRGLPVDDVMNTAVKAAVATASEVKAAAAVSATESSDASTSPASTGATTDGSIVEEKGESMDVVHGSVDVGELDSPIAALEGQEFLNTVAQFATTRSYTVFQAVQLMEMAMENNSLDSFDRVNFAVSLWKA